MRLGGFGETLGLADFTQVDLTMGYLKKILSPEEPPEIRLEDAQNGAVIYFRLQSLLSQQLVTTVGKLVINHLRYIAGTAHRETAVMSSHRLRVRSLPTLIAHGLETPHGASSVFRVQFPRLSI